MREFVQAQDAEHQHRAGAVLRVRAGSGGPDDRPGAAAAGHRLADHRARHHHRRRHPQVGGRHRRDQPGVAPADPGAAAGFDRPGPAPPPGPGTAAAARRGPTRRRSWCCSPTGATPAVSSRWRRPRSPPTAGCGCTRSASAPATRRRWSAPRPSWAGGGSRASGPAVRSVAAARRGFLVADEPTLREVATRHRRGVLRGRRRGPAAERPGGPAAHRGDPAPRRRGERGAGRARPCCCCAGACGRRPAGPRSRPEPFRRSATPGISAGITGVTRCLIQGSRRAAGAPRVPAVSAPGRQHG